MACKFDHEAAFSFWVAAGHERSLYATAKRFKVSRRSISKAARKGDWHARLAKIEADAQEKGDKLLAESRAQVRERHLKIVRAVLSRGVQGLQANQLDGAMQSIKAIEIAVKLERAILGEPGERVGHTIEEVTRREVESFLASPGEPDDEDVEDEIAKEPENGPAQT